MEPSTPDNHDMLFFHQQRNSTRQYKRVRKEPEELPQALRYFKYANLNPRIAAFLGKQDPKNILKRAKGAKDGKEAVAQSGGEVGIMGAEFGTDLSHEARSLLPEIGQGKLDAFGDDGFGFSRLSFNNDNEDPQRFQFEETTFAAPNILRELADTLSRFTNTFKEYSQRTTLYDPGSGEPLAAEATKPSVLLPAGITELLCQEWDDVVANTVYTPRVWQSTAYMGGYKYANTIPSAKPDANLPAPAAVNTTAQEKSIAGGNMKSELKSMVELLDDARNKPLSRSIKKEGDVTDAKPDAKRKTKPSMKDLAQASTLLSAAFGKKDWSQRSNMSIAGGPETTGVEKIPRHGNQTLCFNLSSKKAFDEGWIVNSQSEQNLEQDNLLEWATGKLQNAIKQKEHEDESAKATGNDKALLIRYYGDSRRDTLMKLYRKSDNEGKSSALPPGLLGGRKPTNIPKIPQLSKIDDSKRERFLVQVPDGSLTVYYPKSGEVAISASATPGAPGNLYVHCYANDDLRTCLATFTPYGNSCCYHSNGIPALVLAKEGGMLKAEDGSLIKKWEWPRNNGRLKENVLYHINKEMYLRISSRSLVTLHFTSNRENTKLIVGATQNTNQPDNASLGHLQSGYKLSSKAATEYHTTKSGKDDKSKAKHRKTAFGLRKSQSKKPADLEELKHSLDPPERFEFESQADRELQKLVDRSKLLVDQWMEHYRIEVGISSPALKKLLDKPEVKSSVRNIHSARERKIEDDGFPEKGTKFQSFRSPSAPPKHMVPGPNSVNIKADLKRGSHSNDKKSPETHVRIEATPVTIEDTPIKTSESQPIRSRPATHGSRILIRPQKSSMRASSVASHKVGEKSWSPAPECCPVVTRNKKIYTDSKGPDRPFSCKCSKHRIPQINDIEFDCYIRLVAPPSQVVVISIVNSLYPDAAPYEAMLDNLYLDKNKNRTKPCMQSRHDLYRTLRYDLAVAKSGTNRTTPLLLGRHNVVPGMTLMYCGGRLIFADHIFNGYGNARNDFKKQVYKTRQEYLMGHLLPDDFRFTPGRGKPGARAAWGGEVGGAGVDGKGRPGMFFDQSLYVAKGEKSKSPIFRTMEETKSASDVTSESTRSPIKMPQSKSFDTARDFVQYSLSTRMYVVPPGSKRARTTSQLSTPTKRQSELNSTFPPASATPHSVVTENGSIRLGQMKSFGRMQAVK
ncbi:uncharacterized protein LOC100175408 isoform X1 [Ciona intestinalis]